MDIKTCMDELIFGRPEKSGRGGRTSCPRKSSGNLGRSQLSCSSVKMQEKVSPSNDISLCSQTGGSLEKQQTMSWMENSFMPKDRAISRNKSLVAHASNACSEKSVIDKSSSACAQTVKRNCKIEIRNPDVRCSKAASEPVSTECLDSHADLQSHALKRLSSELGKLDAKSNSDDQATACKRSKPNEVNIALYFMFSRLNVVNLKELIMHYKYLYRRKHLFQLFR